MRRDYAPVNRTRLVLSPPLSFRLLNFRLRNAEETWKGRDNPKNWIPITALSSFLLRISFELSFVTGVAWIVKRKKEEKSKKEEEKKEKERIKIHIVES